MGIPQLVVAIGYSTTGHSVADIIQNAASRTQSKELVVVNSNQLIKRTSIIKPTWHAPWKLMRVSILYACASACLYLCMCMCTPICVHRHHVCGVYSMTHVLNKSAEVFKELTTYQI